jgi:hypothetical protein
MGAKELVAEIAKVERTFLGVEDHGILTAWVYLNYGGAGQGAGGYAFDSASKHTRFHKAYDSSRVATAFGMEWIRRVLLAFGVDSWEELTGRTVYALREPGFGGLVRGFRPLPTETGKEFLFSELDPIAELEKPE